MSILIVRQTGQATSEELQSRDFRRELEEKEQVTRQKREREKPRSFTGTCTCTLYIPVTMIKTFTIIVTINLE